MPTRGPHKATRLLRLTTLLAAGPRTAADLARIARARFEGRVQRLEYRAPIFGAGHNHNDLVPSMSLRRGSRRQPRRTSRWSLRRTER